MNKAWKTLCILSGCAALGAVPALAHHSYAMFDLTKETSVSGTVKEWKWVNPHSWLYIMAPGPNGGEDVEWALESGPIFHLSAKGWTRTMVKPGDKVSVVINPRKDGTAGGNLKSVTLPSGEVKDDRGGPQGLLPARQPE